MFHTKTTSQNVIHRLKIAQGHLEKVIKMVENDVYCIDVLTQTKAVRSAIHKAEEVLLENHVVNCIEEHVKAGRAKQATDEIMRVFKEK